MQTITKEYLVDKSRIGFIRFIFEAHEGVAVPTTLDAEKGHIKLAIAPGRMETAKAVVDDLKRKFRFEDI